MADSARQAYLAHCAACHLETGQGVPSAFPPLDARIGAWAATDSGRDYLVSVVSNGLFGPIEVNGTPYAGAMPQMKHIESEQLAAALNHVVTVFAEAQSAPFTAEELWSRSERQGAVQSRALRPGN